MTIKKRVIATRCDFMRDDKATWNFDKPLRKQFTGIEQMTIDIEKLARDAGAIIHKDGNIFLTNSKKLKHFADAYTAQILKDDIQQERDINESLQNQLRLALEHIKTLEAELEIRKQQAIYATWGQKDNG